jgi:hypothetical protein
LAVLVIRLLPAWFATRATSATTAATAAAAATAVSTEPAAAATATPAALTLRSGFVHVHRPAAEFGAIESCNSPVRFIRIRHLHESKSARTASFPISHDAHTFDSPVCLKHSAQTIFGCAKS